jgi:hypothetical protein
MHEAFLNRWDGPLVHVRGQPRSNVRQGSDEHKCKYCPTDGSVKSNQRRGNVDAGIIDMMCVSTGRGGGG